jgi:peptidoglycan/LPS O-acetylase OafA/YrhL
MKYRNDIAGLRAVAVLPILLFHAGVTALPGGFIGVDIFFVISGFLITSIICREMDSGVFSQVEFYRRRVARIVPALSLVLISTLVAGYFLLLPFEMRDLGKSVASAALFVSNFFFMVKADYFGGAAESKPLLHTWSLAVEEQFYIFYPIGVFILKRWAPKMLKPVLCAGVISSLALAFLLNYVKPDAAFYLIPARAWELGAGGLIALNFFPAINSKGTKQLISVGGLAAIFLGCFLITSELAFPAPWALVPVMGTVLLIAYGQDAITFRFLSSPPMTFIGDISYSTYLWHWPVITFYRLLTGNELDLVETVALVSASIGLAWLTYLLVERPLLKRLRKGAALPIALGGLGVLVAIAVAALLTSMSSDRLGRYPAEIGRIASYASYTETQEYKYQYFDRDQCLEASRNSGASTCMRYSTDKRNVLIFGDSHATQYWRAFSEKYTDDNVMKASTSGCRPTVRTYGLEKCTEMVNFVLAELLRVPAPVQSVVLAGRWRPEDVPLAAETVRKLMRAGIKVTVIGPMVEYDGEFPLILARARLQGIEPGDAMRIQKRKAVEAALRPAIEATGATYVSAQDIECPRGRCILMADDRSPMHFDYGHLTLGGARYMVARMPKP